MLRRLPQHWPLGTLFVLILAANETALRSGAELRSYFLSLCAASVAVIAVTVGWLEGSLPSHGQRAVLWIALLIGFNLHILTSLVIGALLLPFLILAWLRGRRALFRQMLTPAVVGGSVFLAVSMVQMPMWQANTTRFWIPAGADAARWAIDYAVLRAAEANWLALIAGVAGAALLLLGDLRARRPSPALECMAVLGAGIALSTALLIGLHLLRPVVTERYLTALIPAVAMGIAVGACAAMRALPARLGNALVLGASALTVWSLVGNANRTAERKSWEGTSAKLEQLVRQCPDSPVHIDPPFWNAFA
ncbi:MAG: hypothetical protein ABL926_12385 [Novosphingobium sp.]|uniref:hypothetical protein n=1 Tax=Novosphingobium sp. TaxID=1874826 RepID=UPI0032B7C907